MIILQSRSSVKSCCIEGSVNMWIYYFFKMFSKWRSFMITELCSSGRFVPQTFKFGVLVTPLIRKMFSVEIKLFEKYSENPSKCDGQCSEVFSQTFLFVSVTFRRPCCLYSNRNRQSRKIRCTIKREVFDMHAALRTLRVVSLCNLFLT